MKHLLITALAALVLPTAVHAQDDMYFTPTKGQVKAAKEARAKARETYYGGINKNDDEYNRRYRVIHNNDVAEGDSLNDIIEFQAGPGDYSDTLLVSRSFAQDEEDDYEFSRRLSRFEDYYYLHNDPWYWRHHYWASPYYAWNSWVGPWHGWYGPGSMYDFWYDPWYYPWHYSPLFAYDRYWGWYGGGYYPYYGYHPWGYGGGHIARYNGPTGTTNHGKGTVLNRTSSHSASYITANRNGGQTTASTGRYSTNRQRVVENRERYNSDSDRSFFNSNFGSSNRSSSVSSGSSRGGGGGGGFGGGRSGSGGGGHFGGGRR